jgi:lipid A 3-O-deacylase
MINVTVGEVGIADNVKDPYKIGIDYYFRPVGNWRLTPAIGLAAMKNGARFVHTDLRRDFWLSERWILIPSFGVGLFKDGEDFSLGQTLEFRSGIEIVYRFHEQWRVGLALFHLSNGGLADRNPGTEALMLSLGVPLQQ